MYNHRARWTSKRLRAMATLILTSSLLACGGGSAGPTRAMHLTSGMVQVQEGNAWYQKGCYERALPHFLRAHELFAVSDQVSGVAMSMNNIGSVNRIIGDTGVAVRLFDESYRAYASIQDNAGAVHALSNKAAALIDADRLEESERVLDEADSLARKHGISYNPLLSNRGVLLTRKGDYDRAEEVIAKALANADPSNRSAAAAINTAMANLMVVTERFDRAIGFYEEALAADRISGFHKGIADDLAAIGNAYASKKRYEPAADHLERSIKVYALIGNDKRVSDIMAQLEEAAGKANLDISVTKEFASRWLAGEADGPCD